MDTMSKVSDALLPFSLEAEQAVLGAILADAQCLIKVTELIPNKDAFYKSGHRLIFDSYLRLAEKNENIDLITVSEYLKNQEQLQDAGGRSYLAELTNAAPVAANAEYYAQIVKTKAIHRNMINAENEIVELGYKADEDLDILVDKAEQVIFNLAQNKSKESLTHIENIILTDSWEQLEERAATKNMITGLATGFYDFDSF